MKSIKIIGLIVIIAAIYGGYVFPKASYLVQGVSSPGATSTTAKFYTVTVAPSTDSATTTSMLNTDSTDRMISSSQVSCTSVGTSKTYLTGAGLINWSLQMSTGTVSQDAKINTNYASNMVISTSSPWNYTSSSTPPALGAVSLVWPTGTYLNMTFSATNTAACTVGVHTMPL